METYRVRGNKFLVVNKYGNACQSDTAPTASYKTSIREDSLIEMREYLIIESVDSISRDEQGFPLTQYITNGRISRARYTIMYFKHHHRVLRLISNRMSV